jgi:hypothetical protein
MGQHAGMRGMADVRSMVTQCPLLLWQCVTLSHTTTGTLAQSSLSWRIAGKICLWRWHC